MQPLTKSGHHAADTLMMLEKEQIMPDFLLQALVDALTPIAPPHRGNLGEETLSIGGTPIAFKDNTNNHWFSTCGETLDQTVAKSVNAIVEKMLRSGWKVSVDRHSQRVTLVPSKQRYSLEEIESLVSVAKSSR